MIEVFKTNVNTKFKAKKLALLLLGSLILKSVNFDIEDCDRVLRIESSNPKFECSDVIDLLAKAGFNCEILNE